MLCLLAQVELRHDPRSVRPNCRLVNFDVDAFLFIGVSGGSLVSFLVIAFIEVLQRIVKRVDCCDSFGCKVAGGLDDDTGGLVRDVLRGT